MTQVSQLLVLIVAIIHIFILWLEMFAWITRARKVFRGMPDDFFAASKSMAANQGLYNGFLAAGLFWSVAITDAHWSVNTATFFLLCVLIAGLYGGITVQRSIVYVQALPALAALLSLYFF